MPSIQIKLTVLMEDGATWDVTVDQRDIANWEMQGFYDDERTTVRQRFVAFAASARGKQTELSWPRFNALCVEVMPAEAEGSERVDPTRQGQPEGI
jgi:hypothetical protein